MKQTLNTSFLLEYTKRMESMLGYSDMLSRPNIEMNIILEPIIKKVI